MLGKKERKLRFDPAIGLNSIHADVKLKVNEKYCNQLLPRMDGAKDSQRLESDKTMNCDH